MPAMAAAESASPYESALPSRPSWKMSFLRWAYLQERERQLQVQGEAERGRERREATHAGK